MLPMTMTGKRVPLKKAARHYLDGKSEREISRLLGWQAQKVGKKGGARPLRASNRWQKWEIELLGEHPDKEVARLTGRGVFAVNHQRRQMRIMLRNGPIKRWRAWDRALLGKIPDADLARRTGRSIQAISLMRYDLGIKRFGGVFRPRWSRSDLKLLGALPDAEVARRTGRTRDAVIAMRHIHHIPRVGPPARGPEWTPERIALLGTMSDPELARQLHCSIKAVLGARHIRGVSPYYSHSPRTSWSPRQIALLGTLPDSAVAKRLNRSRESVKSHRRLKGIPAFRRLHHWTKAQDEVLLRLPPTEAARELNQDLQAVCSRLKQLRTGFPVDASPRPWSAEEIALLGTLHDGALARQLGRTLYSVAAKRRALRIPPALTPRQQKPTRIWRNRRGKLVRVAVRPWTPQEDRLLGTLRDRALAVKLGRTLAGVKTRRKSLGIPSPRSKARSTRGPKD
jgi:hypothetical protein